MKKLLLLLVIVPMCAWGQVITTIAGNTLVGAGNGNSLGDNGPAINAGLNLPEAVAFDSNGNLYVVDHDGNKIRKISPTGIITTFAGTGTSGSSGDNGLAISAQLHGPHDVAFDAVGNAYIADGLNTLRKVTSATGIITTIAGSAGLGGFSGDNGPAVNAMFHTILSVAVDNAGNVILVDGYNNRIRKINTNGIVTTIAGGGTNTPGDNGLATDAQLNCPAGVAIDNIGNIFFSEECSHKIRKINSAGIITTVAGDGTMGNGGDNGLATNAQLNTPCLIHIDNNNNIFIADPSNNNIRKVVTSTGIITTIAGNGTIGYSGDGGIAVNAQFHYPNGSTTDASGNIYIADGYNNRIRKICFSATLPTISIAATPSNSICAGILVTFTATPSSATSPSYQWIKNGANVGTNSTTYTYTPSNGDSVRCVITKTDACAGVLSASSNTINMTVNPTVVPSVSITVSPSNTVCTGTSVTFTATATNSGTTPTYQWKKNGSNVGTNSSTFTYTPANGDSIKCVLTSNATCASPVTATSNIIAMTVSSMVEPTITVIPYPNDTVCVGTTVTYTAYTTIGGTTPTYQWKKNGVNVGTNSSTYTYTPNNGDSVRCVLTSNAACASPTVVSSSTINMTVSPIPGVAPTVSITATQGNTVCAGITVHYVAIATNAGTLPVYQWYKNGVLITSGYSNSYSYVPNNNDSIRCVLISDQLCAVTVSSNTIQMTVGPTVAVTPTVAITANPNVAVCSGNSVTYTAAITNGGSSPVYQWQKNGVNVGTNSSTYTYSPSNGDNIKCVLTSNATCATPAVVNSNVLNMVVYSSQPAGVSITDTPYMNVCVGTTVLYTATPTNGGTSPTYQWKKNGVNVGTNSTTYSYIPAYGDSVRCVMTSNATCASVTTASSNMLVMALDTFVTPVVSITANGGNTVCAGTNVMLTATPVAGGGSSPAYQWKVNGVNVGTNSNTYNYIPNNGDSVRCVMTSNASCSNNITANSNTVHLIVNSLNMPTIVLSAQDTVVTGSTVTVTATVVAGSSYSITWLMNGATYAITQVPPVSGASITYTKGTGTDSVRAIVVATGTGCYDSIVTSAPVSITGVAPATHVATGHATDMQVYPNPAQDVLYITHVATTVQYELQNIVGVTVLQGTFDQEHNTLQLTEIPAGIYLLQLTDAEGQRAVVRVVKE